ncbi:RANBP2-like and GRIP domain-containing protein 5 [Wickerhamomyces ciferrii]|uniref:RANBP2-like and GRIP domain-containing protein 5 n=1 Tax=Wickerhamomyces ciferrii (strain ATCC 14091 / BCRC 22168 / CBS 111 / JCM 3599 / NBRC 0793 / NRRL Y-1031 F-60-10) TaxID=1206466 RepID=K0KQC5_WICCF|nr:RANBP2-like and GRIP domain-containing protein 5 [Wickerhamomyces ciferrii]CCH44352.1 RANBP2-like and GRIP domain-containing protein 5 [Wickerhamomyces ciferrii]
MFVFSLKLLFDIFKGTIGIQKCQLIDCYSGTELTMAADKIEESELKVTEQPIESAGEGAPLTRKRTRDDVEEEEDKKDETENNPEERPIAQVKRRKDTSDGKDQLPTESKSEDSEPTKISEDTSKGETNHTTANDEIENKDNESEKTEESIPKESTTESPEETKEQSDDKVESKEESKKEQETETSETKPKEEQKQPEKPKFVFGSTTSFGANAFSLLDKKKNVFDRSSSESPKPSGSTTPSVFGSNSKFGNAFQSSIAKKNIFDKTPEEQTKEKEEVEKSRETTPSITGNLYKQVDLEKKEIKSGEEGEEQVFTCRAKLYALDFAKVSEGWKERGIGNIHVNKALDTEKKSRIIMRSIGLLKVILNTPLVKGLEVNKGMPSSLASEKFIRITIVEDGKPMQYALKTGNPETTTDLFNAIDDLIPKDV